MKDNDIDLIYGLDLDRSVCFGDHCGTYRNFSMGDWIQPLILLGFTRFTIAKDSNGVFLTAIVNFKNDEVTSQAKIDPDNVIPRDVHFTFYQVLIDLAKEKFPFEQPTLSSGWLTPKAEA